MQPRLAALAACLLVASSAASAAPAAPQLRSAELSKGVRLSWAADAKDQTIDVQFAFDFGALKPDAPPGYIAVGLSETGSMKGADIWLLSKNATSGAWELGDYHATGFVRPERDAHQDLRLISSQQAPNGTVSARLRRALAPCDSNDLPITSGAAIYVIWAYGAGDLSYHGPRDRGSKLLTLAPAAAAAAPAAAAPAAPRRAAAAAGRRRLSGPLHGAEPGVDAAAAARASVEAAKRGAKVFNLTLGRVEIPTNETTYMVKYIQLPHDRKRWITHYAPLFNSPLVHHAVVYTCAPDIARANISALAAPGGAGLGPFESSSSRQLACHDFWLVTTPNQRPFDAPPRSGLPFGAARRANPIADPGAAPPTAGESSWVALEIHYNNPEGLSGQVDPGSGVWFEYTDGPMDADVGLLTLGQLALNIPPGKASFSAPPAVCTGACTARFNQPITLLDQGYHMHGAGKSAITRRFKGGKEQPPLHELRAYDYGFQSLTPVPEGSRTLQPGERLEFTCTFDTRDRNSTTFFGPGTHDEMCFHWIYYTPAQDNMGFCSNVGNATMAACSPDVSPAMFLGYLYQLRQAAQGNPSSLAPANPRRPPASLAERAAMMGKILPRIQALKSKGLVVDIPEEETAARDAAAPYKAACSAAVPPA